MPPSVGVEGYGDGMAELTVLYDEGCGFCTRVALRVAAAASRRHRADRIPARLLAPPRPHAGGALRRHATSSTRLGRRRSGGAALAPLARTLPGGAALAAACRRLPRARPTLRYGLVARNRGLASKLLRAYDRRRSSASDGPVTVTLQPPARHLLRAKDLIDARYREPLDVPALARAAHLSTAHFSREFRKAFGETPHQYLLTRRLERAAALLRSTDRSVVRDLLPRRACGASARSRRASGGPSACSPLAYRAAYPPAADRVADPDVHAASPTAGRVEQFWRRQPTEP